MARDARSVRAARQRGDAPADAGAAGRALLRALAGAVPGRWCRSRTRPRARCLALWSGLGYNRRALALQNAARVVAASGWPDDLTALPGVGPYTAAAVSSFAWDVQVAAVDTNVRRVLSRRDGVVRSERELAARAASLLPEGRAATFNQAMMELGATVCRPRAPVCAACPVAAGCGGPLPAAPRRSGRSALRGHRPLGARAGARGAARGRGAAGARRSAWRVPWPGLSATAWWSAPRTAPSSCRDRPPRLPILSDRGSGPDRTPRLPHRPPRL